MMMGGTARQTDQTVSKQQSLKAGVSSLHKWASLVNIYTQKILLELSR